MGKHSGLNPRTISCHGEAGIGIITIFYFNNNFIILQYPVVGYQLLATKLALYNGVFTCTGRGRLANKKEASNTTSNRVITPLS